MTAGTSENILTWTLNNLVLNDLWVTEKTREVILKILEANENDIKLREPLGHSKGNTERRYIAMNAYIKKTEKFQIIT
jgi:hypothetical protein